MDFNLVETVANREVGYDQETKSPFSKRRNFERRTGVPGGPVITPVYREEYRFSVNVDPYSTVRLFIGGRGTAINCPRGFHTN